MQNYNWNSYTIEELLTALDFYIKGPKENKQLVEMLKSLALYLANDPLVDVEGKYTNDIDNRLDILFREWSI
jgi:hypothetical protein